MKRPLKVYREGLEALIESGLLDASLLDDLLADLKEVVSREEPESLFDEGGDTEKCPLFVQALADLRFRIQHGLEDIPNEIENREKLIQDLDSKETCIEEKCQMWGPLDIDQSKDMAYFGCALKREAIG